MDEPSSDNPFDTLEPHSNLPDDTLAALWAACELVRKNPGEFAEAVAWLDREYSEASMRDKMQQEEEMDKCWRAGRFKVGPAAPPDKAGRRKLLLEVKRDTSRTLNNRKKWREKNLENDRVCRLMQAIVGLNDEIVAGKYQYVTARRIVILACLISWPHELWKPLQGEFCSWEWDSAWKQRLLAGRQAVMWRWKAEVNDGFLDYARFTNLVGRAAKLLNLESKAVGRGKAGTDTGFSVAKMRELTGLENTTLAKYTRDAGVVTAGVGKRNHKFTCDEVKLILATIVRNSTEEGTRLKCEDALNNLK